MTPPRRLPRWAPLVLLGLLVAARVIGIAVMLQSGIEDDFSILGGDARRYEVIVSSPGTPYRDFDVEYPPLALGLMALVDRPTPLGGLVALAISQLVLELAVAGLLAWAWRRRVALAYLVLGTPMVLFPFPYVRIDLLSVFLAVLGLALLRRRALRSGGGALALSVFAKVWPVVLAPAMVLRRQWRGLTAWVITGAAALAAWVLWAGPSGIVQILTFRGADGWQIESIPGLLFHALDPQGSTVEQGAWRTAVDAPGWARTGLSLVALGGVVLAWTWARRALARPHPTRTTAAEAPPAEATPAGADLDEVVIDGLAPLAAIVSLLVFSSIISPQYVVWFLPFAAVVAARGDRWVGALTLVVVATSTLGLGWIHGLIPGEWHVVAVIGLRNVALMALLTVTLWRLAALGDRPPTPSPASASAPGDGQSQFLRLK